MGILPSLSKCFRPLSCGTSTEPERAAFSFFFFQANPILYNLEGCVLSLFFFRLQKYCAESEHEVLCKHFTLLSDPHVLIISITGMCVYTLGGFPPDFPDLPSLHYLSIHSLSYPLSARWHFRGPLEPAHIG